MDLGIGASSDLKMLTTFDDGSEDLLNSLGEVFDACSHRVYSFQCSSTTIKLEERRVPLKISLNIGILATKI